VSSTASARRYDFASLNGCRAQEQCGIRGTRNPSLTSFRHSITASGRNFGHFLLTMQRSFTHANFLDAPMAARSLRDTFRKYSIVSVGLEPSDHIWTFSRGTWHCRSQATSALLHFISNDRPGFLNRRTILLAKQKSSWKIIHLHASEVAIPTQ